MSARRFLNFFCVDEQTEMDSVYGSKITVEALLIQYEKAFNSLCEPCDHPTVLEEDDYCTNCGKRHYQQ